MIINNNTHTVLRTKNDNMQIFRFSILSLIAVLAVILILNIDEIENYQLLLAHSEPDNELKYYKKLNVNELIRFGTLATNEQRYKSAVLFYEAALDRDPDNVKGLNGLGYALTEQNQLDAAKIYYDKALALDSTDINANNGYGYLHIKSKQFEKAIQFFTTILSMDDDNVNALNGLGLSHTGLENYSQALEIFKNSSNINPEKIETINGIAFTYYRNGQYAESEINYQKVLDKDKNNLDALRGLALVLLLQDKPIESKLLSTTLQINKSIAAQMINEGKYFIDIGEYSKASNIFEEIIIFSPNNVDALYGKAIALKELKQYNDMGYFVNRILELDDTHSGASVLKKIYE